MVDAVERHGRIWQTGSQQRSDGRFRFACELVRNGRIGKVHRAEVGLPTGSPGGDPSIKPVPERLDWGFWLGPAPWRPYQDFGPHWSWRWILDYSGGQLTDWCGHHVDIAHWGLGFDRTGPVKIEGEGTYPTEGLYDVPTHYDFTCTYANGVEINVTNNQKNPQGTKWIGERGWVYVKRGQIDAEPKSLLHEKIGPDEIKLYNSGGHKRNFIDCVLSRKETICPAEIGHRSISVGLLGEIATLTGRTIRWNPETEEILDDPAASALLGRSYREPWQL
jgi:predicted dehydrogenase